VTPFPTDLREKNFDALESPAGNFDDEWNEAFPVSKTF